LVVPILLYGSDQLWNFTQTLPTAVANPTILDFAERVMGPFVQVDNLTFMAFLRSQKKMRKDGHRAGIEISGPISQPMANTCRRLAANAITYLQDLTEEYGPLRASGISSQ